MEQSPSPVGATRFAACILAHPGHKKNAPAGIPFSRGGSGLRTARVRPKVRSSHTDNVSNSARRLRNASARLLRAASYDRASANPVCGRK
jgi:hypothetical protein